MGKKEAQSSFFNPLCEQARPFPRAPPPLPSKALRNFNTKSLPQPQTWRRTGANTHQSSAHAVADAPSLGPSLRRPPSAWSSRRPR